MRNKLTNNLPTWTLYPFCCGLLFACGGEQISILSETTPPNVISINPADNEKGVSVNAEIAATFSENIDAVSLTSTSFTLSNGVTGKVTYSGTTAVFKPSGVLEYSTIYTATVTTEVRDTAYNALPNNYTWSFQTEAAPTGSLQSISGSSFIDISNIAGLGEGPTWSSAWRDFDLDGLPDLFETNHGLTPSLYRNNGDDTFTDLGATLLGYLDKVDKHGSAWANIDSDPEPELMIEVGASQGNSTSDKVLLDRIGSSYFNIASTVSLLDPYGRGRTPIWADVNSDGILDIILTNTLGGIAGQSLGMRFLCRDLSGQFSDCTPLDIPATVNLFAVLSDLYGDSRGELILFSSGTLTGYATLSTTSFTMQPFVDVNGTSINANSVTDAKTADFNGDGLQDILLIRSTNDAMAKSTGTFQVDAHLTANSKEVGFAIQSAGDIVANLFAYPTNLLPQDIFIGSSGYHPTGCLIAGLMTCTIPLSIVADSGMFSHVSGQDLGLYIGYDAPTAQWNIDLSSPMKYRAVEIVAVGSNAVSVISSIPFKKLDSYILYNLGGGRFSKSLITDTAGRNLNGCSGAAVADFDNDADQDIFLTCRDSLSTTEYKIYWNMGNGIFQAQDITADVGGVAKGIADAPSVADFDQNGFQDIFIPHGFGATPFNMGGQKLLKNQGNTNHWLAIDLRGSAGNVDAVGATVSVTIVGNTQKRVANNGASPYSQDDRILMFGIGTAAIVDRVEVLWPDGVVSAITDVIPDTKILIEHP